MGAKIKELWSESHYLVGGAPVAEALAEGTAGFGNYGWTTGLHAFFCIFEKLFPVPGRPQRVTRRQLLVPQRVIFWHSFPIYPFNHAIVLYMKTSTAALFFAILISAFGRANAQVSTSATVTPTLMMGFTGKILNNTAQLNWTMESQTNCKWFVIERSGDNGGFDSVSVVILTMATRTNIIFSIPIWWKVITIIACAK